MMRVLLALVALSTQRLVSAQSPPFQNGTAPTETSSPDAQVTDDPFTTETGSPYSTSTAEQTASAALKGGGGGGGDNYCYTKTVTEYCTVTEKVCDKHCPGRGKTTYVWKCRENDGERLYAN